MYTVYTMKVENDHVEYMEYDKVMEDIYNTLERVEGMVDDMHMRMRHLDSIEEIIEKMHMYLKHPEKSDDDNSTEEDDMYNIRDEDIDF